MNRPGRMHRGMRCNVRWQVCAVFITLAIVTRTVWPAEPTIRDLEFARVGERILRLDLYRPSADARAVENPLIIWVHGGAWRSGTKDNVPILRWLNSGFSIASVEYRLSPEEKFPAQVHDIKAAIRFLRAHHQEFGLDSSRFVIAGASAGGHLAALTGVSRSVPELEGRVGEHLQTSSSIQGIVSFYGASNLQTILLQSTEHGLSVRVPALQLLLGGQPDAQPELAKLASATTHVDKRDPPMWLIHGDADPQMPLAQSQELAEVYRNNGLHVEFEIIPGAKHGGDVFFEADRLDRIAHQILEILRTNGGRF